MIVSGLAFTIYLLMVKLLGSEFNAGVLAFWRAAFALVLTLPFMIRAGWRVFMTDRPVSILGRSLGGALGFYLAIEALSGPNPLPLAQYSAISFSRTLFVVVLAALILREAVGIRRWSATLVGFAGVLVMAQPGGGVEPGTWLALGSSLAFAFAIILVKSLSASHSALNLLTLANLLSCAIFAPFLVIHWSLPSVMEWLLLLGMAGFGVLAQFCYITAMRIGDASFQAPLDYLRLPMTAVSDWLVFRAVPGMNIWFGAAIIVGATLFISFREAMLGRERGNKSVAGP